jgi:hypothetical protein
MSLDNYGLCFVMPGLALVAVFPITCRLDVYCFRLCREQSHDLRDWQTVLGLVNLGQPWSNICAAWLQRPPWIT